VTNPAWRQHGFAGSAADLLIDTTLVHGWMARWTANPDHPAIQDADGPWLNNQQLDERCTAAAAQLIASGVKPGDRVLMSCVPGVDLVVAHIAVLMSGAIVVPVNTGFTDTELANIAREAEVRTIIITDPKRVTPEVGTTGVVVTSAQLDGIPGAVDRDSLEQVRIRMGSLTSDTAAMLLFTSGTTGKPKGALLSHGNLLASAAALVAAWDWTPKDRLVLCLPLFHMHGLGVGVHGTLLAGASTVILPGFSEEFVFDQLASQQATMLFGVPTMWTRLLRSPRVNELAPLRLCVSGSAPLSPDVWNGLAEHGDQDILERYGMTETVMLTSNPLHGVRKPGSVGLPLPGVEVRVNQPGDDGVGELVVRGPNVFAGYLNRPDANADAFVKGDVEGDAGGNWFRTGDLGRVDDDGYFTIVGRSKDLIISGGYNVYPSDVEAILAAHPSVMEVAVIGEPSELWGETVTACVVVSRVVSAEELIAFAAQHLADYQRPRRVVLFEALPRNALGKIVKATLAQQVRMEP
jgi:malonyl-CoA/methylmalonyl-CoA synthetase